MDKRAVRPMYSDRTEIEPDMDASSRSIDQAMGTVTGELLKRFAALEYRVLELERRIEQDDDDG